jgi:hypothetical protein
MKLYLIAEVGNDGLPCAPVKVGVSENPKWRLRALQTGNGRSLMIVETWRFPNQGPFFAARMERIVHQNLGGVRMCGEWFEIAPVDAFNVIEHAIIDEVFGPEEEAA